MSIRRTTTTVTTAFPSVPFQRLSDNRLLTDIFSAYFKARSNKRNTASQVKFERNLSSNLINLYEEILERRYKPGRSMCFIIDEPVKREVFAASFRDRIVHHYLYDWLNPIFDPTFIYDSYSCRKGKGTLFAIDRLAYHIRSCSENYHKQCYALKLDIEGYFMKIDRHILYNIIMSRLDRLHMSGRLPDGLDYDTVAFLVEKTVFLNPASNCYIKGSMSDWEGLPDSKSLFKSKPGCGLPIGNLTSQLFSNVYLNDLDNYVKRELKFRHYGRYVDDIYLVDNSEERLQAAAVAIDDYLSSQLHLRLNPRKVKLMSVDKGVPFLGAVVTPAGTMVSGKTMRRIRNGYLHEICYQSDPYALQSVRNSCKGYFSHFKSHIHLF